MQTGLTLYKASKGIFQQHYIIQPNYNKISLKVIEQQNGFSET